MRKVSEASHVDDCLSRFLLVWGGQRWRPGLGTSEAVWFTEVCVRLFPVFRLCLCMRGSLNGSP